MEEGTAGQIFHDPKHPYTLGLLKCLPRVDEKRDRLTPIHGQPPNLAKLPPGCPFVDRCDLASETKNGPAYCRGNRPPETSPETGRRTRCWLYS